MRLSTACSARWRRSEANLEEGDCLVFWSDGIPEAANADVAQEDDMT
jgi:serine phosphatase RsbU (regulator of sigma subunit)